MGVSIKDLLGKKFPSCRPSFLNGMQLDGYNEELKLAFEYHGSQHYSLNPMFHKRGQIDLDEQKSQDQKKRDICKQEVDEVKPSKKYQGDPHALEWPFRIIVAGASNSGERNVKCDDVILCGHHLNEPKYRIVRNFYKYLAIPTDIRENATHIVLFSGEGSTRKLADIISPYTDADPHKASKVIDGYLRQKEFVVIDINKPRSESFSLRWDTPFNLEKEIELLGNTSN
ncbi:hypothetical protein RhiirA4_486518 [Rhizophagus irregularis]|uniref:Uncharacterized protein n=1 Tax=Rhizophagus irregularis TaxID=588596 RepID=A0A2I1HRG0_9GLOM|nr:hypothetical protein RhiirA4_486518 [Rhizophagus irregularis]